MSTWRGDLGYSDLIGEHGISKADPCFDVLGTLDEASAALGLARALAIAGYTKEQILQVQEHLCWMMSELAARDPVADGHYILAEHVAWLDEQIHTVEAQVPRPTAFVAAGNSTAGAALQLARTMVRRAERLVVRLDNFHTRYLEILAYLNHLSAYLFSLGRYEDAAAGGEARSIPFRSPGPRRAAAEEHDGKLAETTQGKSDSLVA